MISDTDKSSGESEYYIHIASKANNHGSFIPHKKYFLEKVLILLEQ